MGHVPAVVTGCERVAGNVAGPQDKCDFALGNIVGRQERSPAAGWLAQPAGRVLRDMDVGCAARQSLRAAHTNPEWIVGKQEVRAEQRVVQEGSSPSGAQMRGAISKKRGSQPRWPEKVEGMERSKRARRRKLDTAKTDLKPPLVVLRRAGCLVSRRRESVVLYGR